MTGKLTPPSTSSNVPDVLGMITGGVRYTSTVVQCALAIHPPAIAVGQALELLILLQNACDKAIQVSATPQLPRKTERGERLMLITIKDAPIITMQPCEVGLLHIPVLMTAPSAPSEGNQIGVRIDVRTQRGYTMVRSSHVGRPASVLNMSPFRLNILRDAGFGARAEQNVLLINFRVLPGVINAPQPEIASRYEIIWSIRDLAREKEEYEKQRLAASQLAQTFTKAELLSPLVRVTDQRFDQAGLRLYLAEAALIAKMLTYVMEDGLNDFEGYGVENSAWFRRLVASMNDKRLLQDFPGLIGSLYTSVIHDAIQLGLTIVENKTGENFGSREEKATYADEVLAVLSKQQTPDVSHAYLPLVLAGLTLTAKIYDPRENPWDTLGSLREAWRIRLSTAGNQYDWIAQTLARLISGAEQDLLMAHIPRPVKTKTQEMRAVGAKTTQEMRALGMRSSQEMRAVNPDNTTQKPGSNNKTDPGR